MYFEINRKNELESLDSKRGDNYVTPRDGYMFVNSAGYFVNNTIALHTVYTVMRLWSKI